LAASASSLLSAASSLASSSVNRASSGASFLSTPLDHELDDGVGRHRLVAGHELGDRPAVVVGQSVALALLARS
jgi:hypothetical protein